MKLYKYFLLIAVSAFFLSLWSCDDTIDDLLPEDNPYDQSITWSGYYNANKSKPFSGAFNDVSFKFDKEVDGQTFGVVIENTNLTQLSLQLLSIKLKNANVGSYDLKSDSVGSIHHFKDFNKKTEFTAINNGTVTVSKSINKDEISGNFDGWGIAGSDTMYLSGSFNRAKK